MSAAKAFVVTNILVYARDLAAGEKHARARSLVERLWDDRCGVTHTKESPKYPVRFTSQNSWHGLNFFRA
jgi:hypothetical protein